MTTTFPITLDSFINPSGSNHLSDLIVLHSTQHTNLNDAMAAVQNRLGVISSSNPYTIEYELHNTQGGHNHDGINSRQIALGPPPYSGSLYLSGVFSFSSSTPIGEAIDSLNKAFLSSSAKQTIKYEGITQGAGGITNTIDFVGNAVTASYIGNDVTLTFSMGLTESSRRLILLADTSGPFEKYLPGSYREIGYEANNVFPTEAIWYEDNTKAKKIIREFVEYNNNRTFKRQTLQVFDYDGITLLATSVDHITYSGIHEISRTRIVT